MKSPESLATIPGANVPTARCPLSVWRLFLILTSSVVLLCLYLSTWTQRSGYSFLTKKVFLKPDSDSADSTSYSNGGQERAVLHEAVSQSHTDTTADQLEGPLSCDQPWLDLYPLVPPPTEVSKEVKEYVEWHKTARSCLLSSECKQKPQVLIVRCPKTSRCLGLGDRMRGLVFSAFLAMATRRALFIDWPDEPYPLQIALVPSSIDWTVPKDFNFPDSIPHLEWSWCPKDRICDLKEPNIRNMSGISGGQDINFFTDDVEGIMRPYDTIAIAARLSLPHSMYLSENAHFGNRFAYIARSPDALYELRTDFIQSLFRPSRATERKVSEVAYAKGEDYVGVHLRTGRDADETDSKRFAGISANEAKMVRDAFSCMQKLKAPRRTFLAADSEVTKQTFASAARRRGYEVRMFRGETMHYEKVTLQHGKGTGGMTKEDERCDGFLTLAADLMMLSRGRLMVFSGSHFSKLAGMLGDRRMMQLHLTIGMKKRLVVEDFCQWERLDEQW